MNATLTPLMTLRQAGVLTLLLLLGTLAACAPRGRGGNGGRGDDDDATGDDDDATGDDDDATGDDDDSVGDDDDSVGGTLYSGDVYGGLKGADGGGECNGAAELRIDTDGTVLLGVLQCGSDCTIEFSGAYAFGEEPFSPEFDCTVNGYTPNIVEVSAWIWGADGQYTEGSVSASGGGDYFYLSFTAYPQEG